MLNNILFRGVTFQEQMLVVLNPSLISGSEIWKCVHFIDSFTCCQPNFDENFEWQVLFDISDGDNNL